MSLHLISAKPRAHAKADITLRLIRRFFSGFRNAAALIYFYVSDHIAARMLPNNRIFYHTINSIMARPMRGKMEANARFFFTPKTISLDTSK